MRFDCLHYSHSHEENSQIAGLGAKLGATREDETLMERLGFDPYNSKLRGKLFQAYIDKKILPKEFQNCGSIADFLLKTRIGAKLVEEVKKLSDTAHAVARRSGPGRGFQ